MSFLTQEQQGIRWLTSSLLDGLPHGFSTRLGGVSPAPFDALNLGPGRGDAQENVLENYRRFCSVLGVPMDAIALAKQVHGVNVHLCTADDAGKGLSKERDYTADALITQEPGLPLVVFSADCGNILLYDPVRQAVGAVHSGWRGCAQGILEKTAAEMTRVFGTNPADLRAAIGPCIQACCFETDADVPDAMREALGADAEPYLEQRGLKWHVDLAGLNRLWLLRAGLRPERIDNSGLCTACHPEWFWSHRKMGNARGAQIAMIALPESAT